MANAVPEFLFQASKGQSTAGITFNENAPRVRTQTNSIIPLSSRNYFINYEYGIANSISIYSNLTYSDTTVEGYHSGIGPLEFGGKFSSEVGPGSIYSKVNIAANVLDGKLKCSTSNGCNASDGSVSVDLELAYQWSLNNAFTGISLKHGVSSTDIKVDSGHKIEKKAHLTISAFYERALRDNLWGLAISYLDNGGLLGSSPTFPLKYKSFYIEDFKVDAYAVAGYLRTSLTDSSHFITNVEYSRVINNDTLGGKTQNVAFNLTFRQLF